MAPREDHDNAGVRLVRVLTHHAAKQHRRIATTARNAGRAVGPKCFPGQQKLEVMRMRPSSREACIG